MWQFTPAMWRLETCSPMLSWCSVRSSAIREVGWLEYDKWFCQQQAALVTPHPWNELDASLHEATVMSLRSGSQTMQMHNVPLCHCSFHSHSSSCHQPHHLHCLLLVDGCLGQKPSSASAPYGTEGAVLFRDLAGSVTYAPPVSAKAIRQGTAMTLQPTLCTKWQLQLSSHQTCPAQRQCSANDQQLYRLTSMNRQRGIAYITPYMLMNVSCMNVE